MMFFNQLVFLSLDDIKVLVYESRDMDFRPEGARKMHI